MRLVNISVNGVVVLFPECYPLAGGEGNSVNTEHATCLHPLSAGEC